MTMREFLEAQGVPEDDIVAAEEQGPSAVQLLAIDRVLLPGEHRYNRIEVADMVGVDLDTARRYWRGLGFPDTPDEERAFTDSDVQALRTLKELIDEGVIEEDVAL